MSRDYKFVFQLCAFFAGLLANCDQKLFAMAVEDVVAIELNVVTQSEETQISEADSAAVGKAWNSSCPILGERLKPGKGPFGMGAFDRFVCTFRDTSARKSANWLIEVIDSPDQVLVKVSRVLSSEQTDSLQPVY